MYLVGFITRIYHDARSLERQMGLNLRTEMCSCKVVRLADRKLPAIMHIVTLLSLTVKGLISVLCRFPLLLKLILQHKLRDVSSKITVSTVMYVATPFHSA